MPALLAVLGAILVLLAFFDGIHRTELLIENESRAQLLTFGTRIASRLEELYAGKNSRGVSDELVRAASEPHLIVAVVVDGNGNVLESSNASLFGASLKEHAAPQALEMLQQTLATGGASHAIDANGESLDALFRIALPSTRGELRSKRHVALYLHSDLSETKRINWSRHIERALIMAEVVAFAMAMVWLYIHKVVTRRLTQLLDGMQRVAFDDTAVDGDIDVAGKDEVGRLGAAFTAMLAEIRLRRKALEASEERHRSVVQAMSEAVIIFDSKGTIVSANDSAGRIVGVDARVLVSRSIADPQWRMFREDGSRVPAEELPSALVLRTGQPSANVIQGFLRPDGEFKWLSINSAPIWLDAAGRERGAVSTISDITVRLNVELQARRDRERLAAIVDSAMDAVISVDAALCITIFNGAAERMFGKGEAEMLGRPIDMLLPVRYRDAHLKHMRGLVAHGSMRREMGVPGQIVGLRANGSEFPLEASITRVSVGEETILTVILRDISERAQAEEQRAHLEAQLRQSQKMQSLGTLTGGIAHDFNNILTAIAGNVRLAIADLSNTHPVQRSLQEIDKAAARATDLVRQVLAFARRQEAQRVVVDLETVIADALSFLRAMIPTTIEIRTRIAAHLPLVAIDKTQIHQVITNLGSNAAHAIGDRPGVVEVELDDVQIASEDQLRSLDIDAGRYVRLSFSDNGAGIDAALLDRIFEPFFTTKGLGQGTGLGLSVVHGIVKNHDGAIAVQSTRGVGTRFELYFPAHLQDAVTNVREVDRSALQADAGAGKIIVYVDDEDALVFLVTRILERHGYAVLGFNQPKEAIAEIAKNPLRIDALISDLAMPGMTGFDVAREALAVRRDLPIILVSGYIRPQDVESARVLGIQRLILKPDTVDALAATLHELLSDTARNV